MLVIVSTRAIKMRLSTLLHPFIPYDKWLVVHKIPSIEKEILKLLKRNDGGEENNRLMFFVNIKKQLPADFPGIFAGSNLLSLVFYTNSKQLDGWLNSLRSSFSSFKRKALIMSMMKPYYMKWADKIHDTLHSTDGYCAHTFKLFADTTTKTELAEILSHGCSMAFYVGHGRSRGWSAYRGFRWQHMEEHIQRAPVGILISLSCDGFKKDRAGLPFGIQWITSGRACTSIAACGSVQLKPLEAITRLLMESISSNNFLRLDELLFEMRRRIVLEMDADVVKNWNQFRLVGNMLQYI